MPIRVTCSDLSEADAVWQLISRAEQGYSWEIHV